jgi:hypothetical protein
MLGHRPLVRLWDTIRRLLTNSAPNKGLELTASSVRSAPASRRSSGPAFGNTKEAFMLKVNVGLVLIILSMATVLAQEKDVIAPAHEMAVRELIRSQITPQYMEDIYVEAARTAALHFQATAQAALKRELSDHEKQRLSLFWYRQMKEVMSYASLEEMLLPVVAKYLTLAEVEEINRFNQTPVGKKLTSLMSILTREAEGAGATMMRKVADEKWLKSMMEKLKIEFPHWFPALEQLR